MMRATREARVLTRLLAASALAAALCPIAAVAAQAPTSAADAPAKPNDYSDAKTWLCHPGGHDACDVDLSTTIVAADGNLTREAFNADAHPAIDCFYVYPTVSTDPTPNSDMSPDPAETNVVRQQFARFAAHCRPFAPVYRQVTLVGLRRMMSSPGGVKLDSGIGYDDVRDAFRYYLAHDNNGRGFVLIGHSQGSFVLAELIRQEIDGKPIQSKLVSAILLGTTIAVPKDKDVGGTFTHIPLCRTATQTGCVVTYASYRSTIPPPANTLFGKVAEAGMVAACTNPAALGGGSGELHAYLDAKGRTITSTTPPRPWVTPERPIDTPWVSVPGLLTARCSSNENASGFLEVTVHGDPNGPRVNDIVGDIGQPGNPAANWGLHLVDVNIAMGNLVDLVGRQAKAYAK
jgi:hypothetical protein